MAFLRDVFHIVNIFFHLFMLHRGGNQTGSGVFYVKPIEELPFTPKIVPMPNQRKTQEGTALLEREVLDLRPPPLYQVLLLNDDFTPMDFVVHVLELIFRMDEDRAMRVMMAVHTEGRGICGIYTRDIAASKVEQVVNLAREHQHPLACVMEEAP